MQHKAKFGRFGTVKVKFIEGWAVLTLDEAKQFQASEPGNAELAAIIEWVEREEWVVED